PDSGCGVELDWDRAGLRLQVFKVDTKAELEIFDVVGDLDGQLVVGLDARMKLLERPGNRHSVHPLVMLVGPQDSKAQREIVIPEDVPGRECAGVGSDEMKHHDQTRIASFLTY